jgi:hypothetical protein
MGAVRVTVADLEELTSDDVWDRLDLIPAERNVVGKAMSEARRLGLIVGTERFVQSRRAEAKGRRIQVWKRGVQGGREVAAAHLALGRQSLELTGKETDGR